jgi:hypothetical protein
VDKNVIQNVPILLSAKEVADHLNCGLQQIYKYTRLGILNCCIVRIGTRTVRFNSEKLKNAIDQGGLFKNNADTQTILKIKK